MKPTTEAGRTLIAAWRHVSVPWMEARVADIEAAARRLDVGTMADVLTEAHLRRDGHCGESHRAEAEFVIARYVARLDDHSETP